MRYLEQYPDGGYRYQRGVPAELVKLVGTGKRIKRHIGHTGIRDAEDKAARFAIEDSALFARLRRLPAEEKVQLETLGGWWRIREKLPKLMLPPLPSLSDMLAGAPYPLPPPPAKGRIDVPAGFFEQLREFHRYARAEPLRLKIAAETPKYSLDGLYALWQVVREPTRTDSHERALARFKAYLKNDDRDYRDIRREDVEGFCKHLVDAGMEKVTVVKYLECIRGLFSAAVDKVKIASNPGAGIKPDGKVKKGKRDSWTGAEVRKILRRAQWVRLGGDRHEAIMWALRLLVWTGARLEEVFQLNKDDVRVESGVPFVWIRPAREGQSTKTESVHKVPLHPDVAAFVDYAKSRPGEWVFGEFTRHPIKGRGHYLSQVFTSFRRKHVSGSPKKTLHSLRHRFKDVLDNADISLERQRVLRGACANEVIQKYGQGAGLRKLWADVQKLKPFED